MEEGFAGSRLWALLVASATEEETGPLESNGAGGWERAVRPSLPFLGLWRPLAAAPWGEFGGDRSALGGS